MLEDYSIVKFVPLNNEEDESIEQLLLVIDTTIQYGEDLEVRRFFWVHFCSGERSVSSRAR